jgi:GT2 family glycosyltransferase
MQPAVSVIVVNWNGKHLLGPCLKALARQTFTDFETVVVDNGSSDGSAAWLAEAHPEVRLIALDGNLGFAGGNNAGIRATSGEFVALLNNDTEVEPGWLEALVTCLRRHPDVAACDSKVFFHGSGDLLWSQGADYAVSGAVIQRGFRQPDRGLDAGDRREVFIAVACAALYRRQALDQVGLFDEDYFIGYEDVDLSFRLHAAGWRILNVSGAVVQHHVSASTKVNSDFYVYWGQRNVLDTYVKNMPAGLLWKYLPLHLLYTAGSAAYFARHRRLSAFARAKLAIAREWRHVVAKRRAVQALRTVPAAAIERQLTRAWLGDKAGKLLG